AARVEVATLRHPGTVDRDQPGFEATRLAGAAGIERGHQIPVVSRAEGHAFAFAVDDQPGSDALHAACREALHHLAPQHRGDLVAVQAVEDAPGLLGVDEVFVDVTRVLD